jgi:hypothetical protein
MTTEVQELENEKRGSRRRIKESRRGRRISEHKRGHAGQTAALCDLSDEFEANVFRGAPTYDHPHLQDHRNVHNVRAPQARRGAIVHTVELV